MNTGCLHFVLDESTPLSRNGGRATSAFCHENQAQRCRRDARDRRHALLRFSAKPSTPCFLFASEGTLGDEDDELASARSSRLILLLPQARFAPRSGDRRHAANGPERKSSPPAEFRP